MKAIRAWRIGIVLDSRRIKFRLRSRVDVTFNVMLMAARQYNGLCSMKGFPGAYMLALVYPNKISKPFVKDHAFG